MNEPLTILLNKCEALINSDFTSISGLASDIGERPQRISEWVTQRAHEPSGRITMKLHDWCAKKTLQMSMAGGAIQTRYRSAYRAVQERRK